MRLNIYGALPTREALRRPDARAELYVWKIINLDSALWF